MSQMDAATMEAVRQRLRERVRERLIQRLPTGPQAPSIVDSMAAGRDPFGVGYNAPGIEQAPYRGLNEARLDEVISRMGPNQGTSPEAMRAGLQSATGDESAFGAYHTGFSGGALDVLARAGGSAPTDVARIVGQELQQGSYQPVRTVGGVLGQITGTVAPGAINPGLPPLIAGGESYQRTFDRTGDPEASMLAGAINAGSMVPAMPSLLGNVLFNATANPAALVGEELIAINAGATPTPTGQFNQDLLASTAMGAAAPAVPYVAGRAIGGIVDRINRPGASPDGTIPQVLRPDADRQAAADGAAGEPAPVSQAGGPAAGGEPWRGYPGRGPELATRGQYFPPDGDLARRGEYRPGGFPEEPSLPPRQTTLDDMPQPAARRGVYNPDGFAPVGQRGEFRPEGFPDEPRGTPPEPPRQTTLDDMPQPVGTRGRYLGDEVATRGRYYPPPAEMPFRALKAEAEALGVAEGEGGRAGLEQRVEAAREPETIVAAAFRDPRTGEVFTGTDHGDAFSKSGIDPKNIPSEVIAAPDIDGFVTSTGRYVSRSEATSVAIRAKQIRGDGESPQLDAQSLQLQPTPPRPAQSGGAVSKPQPGVYNRGFAKLLRGMDRNDIHDLLFNWRGVDLTDDNRLVWNETRGSSGKIRESKRDFVKWLLSDEPLNPKTFDQDAEWQAKIARARETVLEGESARSKPEASTPEAPPSGRQGQALLWADQLEAAADSIRGNVPRGRNVGGTTLHTDLASLAMRAAARAIRAGVNTFEAVRDWVVRTADEMGINLTPEARTRAIRQARGHIDANSRPGAIGDVEHVRRLAAQRMRASRPSANRAIVPDAATQRPTTEDTTRSVSERFRAADVAAAGPRFHKAISAHHDEHPFGAAVEVKPPEFYSDPKTRLFVSDDSTAGVAVTPAGDLVSVFKRTGSSTDIRQLLREAAPHARTLDGFDVDGMLPTLYGLDGIDFRPAARVRFNPEFAPPGWKPEHGAPDVVLMVRDPDGTSGLPKVPSKAEGGYAAIRDSVPVFDDYDAAEQARNAALHRIEPVSPIGNDAALRSTAPSAGDRVNHVIGKTPSLRDRMAMDVDQASSRKPKQPPEKPGKKSKIDRGRDHVKKLLLTSDEEVRNSPQYQRNFDLLTKDRAFADLRRQGLTGEALRKAAMARMVENLLWLHDQFPAELRDRAKLWYDGARKIAEELRDQYNIPIRAAAAAIAAMSPMTDWFKNVEGARQVIDIVMTKGEMMITPEMYRVLGIDAEKATEIRVRNNAKKTRPEGIVEDTSVPPPAVRIRIRNHKLKDLDPQAASWWVKLYAEAHMPATYPVLTPEGRRAGLMKTKDGEPGVLAWGNLNNVAKVIRALRDPSLENISELIGDEHKVRNFYNDIVTPHSENPHATIDTHAVAADLLQPLSGSSKAVEANFGGKGTAGSDALGIAGTYPVHHRAYELAAAQRGLLVREMQSITWEAVRGLFLPEEKRNAARNARIDELYNALAEGRIDVDQLRAQLLEITGGIRRPSWADERSGLPEAVEARPHAAGEERPAARVDDQARGAADAGELPAGGGDQGAGHRAGARGDLPGDIPVEGSAVEGSGRAGARGGVDTGGGRLDRLEASARQRMRDRGFEMQRLRRQHGRNIGASTLPADIIDAAIIAAARLVKTGAKAVRLTKQAIDEALTSIGAALTEDNRRTVGRVARTLIRGSSENGTLSESRFEMTVAALMRRSEGQPRTTPKAAIRETAGPRTQPKTVTEPAALTAGMRKAEKAAAVAYREGYSTAAGEGKARLEAMESDLRARRATADGIRTEARRLAETLPIRVRGKLLAAIDNATTQPKLISAIRQMRRELSGYEGRGFADSIAAGTRSKGLLRLTQDRRNQIGALVGAPKDARIADVRRAIRDHVRTLRKDLRTAGDTARVDAARDALRDLNDQIKAIHHEHRTENKAMFKGRAASLNVLREQALRDIQTAKPPPLSRRTDPANLAERGETRTSAAVQKFFRDSVTNEVLGLVIAGGKADSPTTQLLSSELWNAENRKLSTMFVVQDAMEAATRAAGLGSLGDAMAKISGTLGKGGQETIRVKIGGQTTTLSMGQAMALLARDAQVRARIEAGNEVSFTTRPNESIRIKPEELAAIADAVPKKYRDLIEAAKDIIERQVRPGMFAAFRRLRGYEPEVIPRHWTGRRNQRLSKSAQKSMTWEGVGGSKGAVDAHLEDWGSTKQRTGGSTPFLVGDFFSEFFEHAERGAAIAHMAETVRTIENVLLSPDMRTAIARKFGDGALQRIEATLLESAGMGDKSDLGLVRSLVRNVSRAKVSVNPASWTRQLGGIATIAAHVPARVLSDGAANFGRKGVMAEMAEFSPYLRHRYQQAPSVMLSGLANNGLALDLTSGAGAAKALPRNLAAGDFRGARRNVGQLSDAIRAASFFDSIPVRIAWTGFDAQAKRQHPDWSRERRGRWVARQVDPLIRRTQNTSDPLSSSGWSQNSRTSWLTAAFTAFTGDSNKAWNQVVAARVKGDASELRRVAAARAINSVWGSLISLAFGAGAYTLGQSLLGADGENTERKDRAMHNAAWQFAREMAGTFPFADRLVDLARMMTVEGTMQNPLDTPMSGTVEQATIGLVNTSRGLIDMLDSEDERKPGQKDPTERFLKGVETLALGGTELAGVPVAPVYRIGKRVLQGGQAKATDDLLYERQQLNRVGKSKRTPEQARRLTRLDAFYSTVSELRQAEKAMVKKGDTARAEQIRQRVDALARRFAQSGEVVQR